MPKAGRRKRVVEYRRHHDDQHPDVKRRARYAERIHPSLWPLFKQFEKIVWDTTDDLIPYEQWKQIKSDVAQEAAAVHDYDWDEETGKHQYTRREIAEEKAAARDACWDCEDPYDAVEASSRYDWDD